MPHPIPLSRQHGLDVLQLEAPDGARATLALHGAHLLSWQPAGADEQLYLSPRSGFASGQAIRGGVPVIFPQFSDRGALPRHGFARSRPWQLVSAEQGEDDALAVLRLSDDAATRMHWPHAFEAELSVRVCGRSLEIELACENRGESAFSFSAALHGYLRVADIDAVSVAGLEGLRYEDMVSRSEQTQRVELLLPQGELDRLYHQIPGPLELRELRPEGERRLQLGQQGFEDTVLWNPGADKCAALADMPADGWRQMLCIEAAMVRHPVELAPGESWAGMQSLTLL